MNFFYRGRDRLVDTALEVHGVHARGDELQTFVNDGLGEHRGGGGAVTGLVRGLGRHFFNHLCAHIFELVFELDLLGDGDAVFGDRGRAEGLVENGIASLGAQGGFHRIGENVDAGEHALTRFVGK